MFAKRLAAISALVFTVALPLQVRAAAVGAAPAIKVYGNPTITNAGKILRFALPAAAAGIALWKNDYNGFYQLAASYITAIGITYGLKHVIREQRPDHSNWQSMPSDSAASASAGAAFLWRRYGWQYGIPAEALSVFVGYSRTQAHLHHWYDVIAGDAVAWGVNMLFVSHYHPDNRYHIGFGASPNGVSVNFAMNM